MAYTSDPVAVTAGSHTLAFLGTDTTGPGIGTVCIDLVSASNTPGSSTSYAQWASDKGLTVGENDGPNQDPDKDGVNNIAEFAFNGDPLSGADNGRIYSLIADSDDSGDTQQELILTVAVRAGTPTIWTTPSYTIDGITYTIEGSTTLDTFAVAVQPVTAIDVGLPDLTGTGYEYRSFSLVGSNGLPGKGFLRAKVESNP